MQDNSPSQHVQEACPSRCTLPYSQKPAPHSLSLPSFLPPPDFSKMQREPIEKEGGNGRGANVGMKEFCGGKEGFAALRFSGERERSVGGGQRGDRGESSGVLKGQDI